MSVGFWRKGECEICHRERDVAVCASAWGPVSYANCMECLHRPAEPERTFKYLYANKPPGGFDMRLRNWYTWIDGRYVNWVTYCDRRKASA